MSNEPTPGLTVSERICDLIEDENHQHRKGLFRECSPDYDEKTCHVVIEVVENDCLALIEWIMYLADRGLRIKAVHYLTGRLRGCIELDVEPGSTKIPKQWSVYNLDPSELVNLDD